MKYNAVHMRDAYIVEGMLCSVPIRTPFGFLADDAHHLI